MKPRIAEQVALKLEKMISSENLQVGDRLPAERNLAKQLEISRPTLREAIKMLISKGFLISKPGGGTFIKSTSADDSNDPMLTLFRQNPEYRFDVLEIRHALEGSAAFYAAKRATESDKNRIKQCYEQMLLLHGHKDPMEEARADAAFHLSIVEASHNLVFLHVMRGLFDLLQNSISHNLDKLYTIGPIYKALDQQHKEMMDAVISGEAEVARDAAHRHLVFVENSIREIDLEESRKRRSSEYISILSGR